MLTTLHPGFTLLANRPPASQARLIKLKEQYPSIPDEFLELSREATELELEFENGQYLRIWEPEGCREMDEAYEISSRIIGAIPLGDDGGGKAIFYFHGAKGFGLYCDDYGNLDAEDAVFVAPSLAALLEHGVGINSFFR